MRVSRDIDDREARIEAVESNCMVVASDNHHSRATSQELPSRFVRPLISMATRIDKAPPVYWLNSLCASLGVKLIQEKVLEDRHENGVDWRGDYGRNPWRSISHENDGFCLYASNRDDGLFGRGFDT